MKNEDDENAKYAENAKDAGAAKGKEPTAAQIRAAARRGRKLG